MSGLNPSYPPITTTTVGPGLMTSEQATAIGAAQSAADDAAAAAAAAQATADAAATPASVTSAIATAVTGLNGGASTIATMESLSSQSGGPAYTDLTTVGPSVVLTVPTGGKTYAVFAKCDIKRNFNGNSGYVSFAITNNVGGATVVAAGTFEDVSTPGSVDFRDHMTAIGYATLPAGSYTVRVKYGNNGGSGTWDYFNRALVVVCIG